MNFKDQQILEVLVTEGTVSPEQFKEASVKSELVAAQTGKTTSIIQSLMDISAITEEQMMLATGKAYNREAITDIAQVNAVGQAIEKMHEEQARALDAVPLGYDQGTDTLYVAVTPQRFGSLTYQDDVRRVTNVSKVHFKLISQTNLVKAWKRIYRAEASINRIANTLNAESAQEAERRQASAQKLKEVEVDDDSAVKKVVTLLIRQAIADGASDIHMEPDGHSLLMRQRVDGVLKDLNVNIPSSIVKNIASVVKLMSNIELSRKNETHDGRMTIRDQTGREVDIRVSIIPTIYGEDIVMRINDNSLASVELDKLGFSEVNYDRFMMAMNKPHGMILVTGPTGSGKSTTLYAALNQISSPEKKIITVENPVEYKLKGAMQIEVNPERSVDDSRRARALGFNTVLPAILRHDPDIILVGETRDKETAQISMDAAMTGHLVLTTLHTNDAASAVIRLKEMGVEPYLVGGVTEGVLAQRLIRRLCVRCKEAYTPTTAELLSVGFWKEDEGKEVALFRATKDGCDECRHTGYRGRVAVHEVLLLDDTIEEMIVMGATATEIQNEAQKRGMVTLREDGWVKVAAGITSIAEVLRVVA